MEKFLIDEDQLSLLRSLQQQLADSSPMPYDMRRNISDQIHDLIMNIREQIVPETIEHEIEEEKSHE